MLVCVICMADGVLEVNGTWYCIDHMESGLEDVARVMYQLSRHKMQYDADSLVEAFTEVLDEHGYYPEEDDDD